MPRCNSCLALTINGVFTHEMGCPDRWRHTTSDCRECGCAFTSQRPHQTVCEDCLDGLTNEQASEQLREREDD